MKLLHRLLFLTTCLSLIATLACGAGLEDKVREHTLKNGMKLLMVERHTSPTVAAWIRFKVGSVNERSDERGLAHMLEHMLFHGTKTIGTNNYNAEVPLLAPEKDPLLAARSDKLSDQQAKNSEEPDYLLHRILRLYKANLPKDAPGGEPLSRPADRGP